MEKPVYDTIGEKYNDNRAADPHILQTIVELLDLPKGCLVADIGAGTGNYSYALAGLGYRVKAIEPSKVMRDQALPHNNVTWLESSAESILLGDQSVDGIIAILCIHHFSSLAKAAKEFHRICPEGPAVVLTYDPRAGKDFWFNEYFPTIYQREFEYFPAIGDVVKVLAGVHWKTKTREFPLPHNLVDKNMHSGWNRPEIYFDEKMRLNTSGFARAQKSEVEKGLSRLKQDLNSGAWDTKYGHLRKETELKTGFVFVKLWT